MSTQLRILFDKSDRKYCSGDLVSGKVVVDAQKEFSCGGLQISYAWRTHGKGNQDTGAKESIELVKGDVHFLKGDHREFPFRFNAPAVPLTYHGHYVNVDWYLEAKLDVNRLKALINVPSFFSVEEDFLLIDSEPPLKDRLSKMGDGITDYSPPSESSSSFSSLTDVLLLLTGIPIFFLAYFLFSGGYPAAAILLIVFLIALIVRKKIYDFAFKSKIEIKEIYLTPVIHPGDRAGCRIQFRIKSSIYLDQIATTVLAVEYAVSGWGTRSQSYTFTTHKVQYSKPYREELAAGRWILYECPLPIPANAPTTFTANNNSINWSIHLKIACKRWPSWEKTIPITISPRSIYRHGKERDIIARVAGDRAG